MSSARWRPHAIESARHSWEAGDRCARGPRLYLASLDIRDIPFSERDSGVWARRGEGGRLRFPNYRLRVDNLPFWAFSLFAVFGDFSFFSQIHLLDFDFGRFI